MNPKMNPVEYVEIGDGIFAHNEPCDALVKELSDMLMDQAKLILSEVGASEHAGKIEVHVNYQNEVTHVWWSARLPKGMLPKEKEEELTQQLSRLLSAMEHGE